MANTNSRAEPVGLAPGEAAPTAGTAASNKAASNKAASNKAASNKAASNKAASNKVAANKGAAPSAWRKRFLAELATTSNVAASAREAGIHPSRAYDARRSDPEFYRRWQEALCEGYDHLEMHLLQRLREGEIKPVSGARRAVRTFDNATAFRLLTVHREQVARQRAIHENRNAEAVLAAIDAKIDMMRERSARASADAGREG
ncbi:hypothetical protein ACFSTD_03070 [Novosphingobium colocasiae]|uniref:Terminase small subunit n=1 Tax=Novosphingobium colocasiae TaxID=1256513 RepID=A0A918PCV4_9SPHN|nr:hypothetical protein [Novosphingobium colocasiae]GGY99552.1 hypothetical protein GCM10011614_13120 [Novosphingobium colocasiae]